MAKPAPATVTVFPEKSPYRPDNAVEYVEFHDSFLKKNDGPAWLDAIRKRGAQALTAQGLPTPNLERFKYTNVAAAVKGMGGDIAKAQITYKDSELISGLLDDMPAWLRETLEATPAGEEQYKDRTLWSLNDAYLRDGIVIDIAKNKTLDKPIELTFTGRDGDYCAPRVVIRIAEGAEATIIERHTGEGRYWINSLTQIIVGDNARLHHYRIQDHGRDGVFTTNTHAVIGRDATYEAFSLTTGASLSRNQIHAELRGTNGTCNTYGINLLRGKQRGDTTLTLEHKAPHCASRQFYRSVIDDAAHGVFQGKVHVHQIAQKTDGYQLSNALILSEGAAMDTKPELEIYADDVKCSHGATTGQVDENALFYMRARGIPLEDARSLLISAFVAEVVERLADPVLNESLLESVTSWLKK